MGSIGAAKTYTSTDWNPAIRRWAVQNDTVSPEDRRAIEAFIRQAPRVDNNLSRGIAVSPQQEASLEVGGTFSEGKLASWSTRVGIAQSFARNNVTSEKPKMVIVRLDGGTNNAGKIGGLGGRRYDEGEAIMSSSASFVITKIKRDKAVNGYTTIWVKER